MFAVYILFVCLVSIKSAMMTMMMMIKINQQNVVSFSVTGVIHKTTSPQDDQSAS